MFGVWVYSVLMLNLSRWIGFKKWMNMFSNLVSPSTSLSELDQVQVVKQDIGPHTPVKRKWTDGNVGAAPAVAVGGSSSEGGQAPAPLTAPAEAEAEAEAEEGLPEGNGEEEEVAAGLILLEPKVSRVRHALCLCLDCLLLVPKAGGATTTIVRSSSWGAADAGSWGAVALGLTGICENGKLAGMGPALGNVLAGMTPALST